MPDGTAFAICTNCARYLQGSLGGEVVGYEYSENAEALIGRQEGGHDFLVVGGFIVDVWAAEAYGTSPTIPLQKTRLIRQLYGNPAHWRVWRGNGFEAFEGRSRAQSKTPKPKLKC